MPAIAWSAIDCPQPRYTGKAPDDYLAKKNPLSAGAVDLKAVERLYRGAGGPTGPANCALCHGIKGDGKGELAMLYDPPPRKFACAKTIEGVPDGQLFWIIRFGSPGTGMPPHPALSDEQIWQLIVYLRQLAK